MPPMFETGLAGWTVVNPVGYAGDYSLPLIDSQTSPTIEIHKRLNVRAGDTLSVTIDAVIGGFFGAYGGYLIVYIGGQARIFISGGGNGDPSLEPWNTGTSATYAYTTVADDAGNKEVIISASGDYDDDGQILITAFSIPITPLAGPGGFLNRNYFREDY